jgi:hypothetical protein
MMIDNKLHALMTHHAMFGSERKEPFPRSDETAGSMRAVQPSHEDLAERIADLEYYMDEVDLGLYTGEDNEPKRAKLAKLKKLRGENSILGTVVKSSSISSKCTSTIRRFDWALIEVSRPSNNQSEGAEATQYLNRIPRRLPSYSHVH